MAKLPGYDSQVAPATGGVQPGNIYLPNIHGVSTDTGAEKMFRQLGAKAEEAGNIFAGLSEKREHEQYVIEGGKAIGEVYQNIGTLQGEMAGAVAPTSQLEFRDKANSIVQSALEKVSPQFREKVASHLVQHTGQAIGSFDKEYFSRIRNLKIQETEQNLLPMAEQQAMYMMQNDTVNAARVAGTAHGYAVTAEDAGLSQTTKGELKTRYDDMVSKIYFDKMIVANPELVKQMLNTPEGRQKLGIKPGTEAQSLSYADRAIGKVQSELYQEAIGYINKKQAPPPDLMARLSNSQQYSMNNLVKSMHDTDNEQVKLDLGVKAIQYKYNATPESAAEGNDLIKRIYEASLSTPTKLQFIDRISNKMAKVETNQQTQDQKYLETFKQYMSADQYKLFLNDINDRPDGIASLPKGATWEDRRKFYNRYSFNYRNNSVNDIIKKSEKGGDFEKVMGVPGAALPKVGGIQRGMPGSAPELTPQQQLDMALADKRLSVTQRLKIIEMGRKAGLKVPN